MYVLIGIIILTMAALGINFCFLMVGGPPWHKGEEHEPVKIGNRTYSIERFSVGVSVSVLGLGWLGVWLYFMITGWDSFTAQLSGLLFHVLLNLAVALSLIFAGIATFRQWKRHKGVLLASLALLMGSILLSIAVYGARGHGTPIFMWLFAAWTFVVGGIFTLATYVMGRLFHYYDERISPGDRLPS